MEQRNPWVGTTFIPDNERMAVPPAWFLQQIHDYDSQLVLVPSKQQPFCYVVARRSRLGKRGLTESAIGKTITNPDTVMCFRYGLVPVCMMYKHGPVWNVDTLLASLKARDLWAHGGADKVADMLEADEAAVEAKRKADLRAEMWDRSGEGWRTYQTRTGQRIVSAGPAHTETAPSQSPQGHRVPSRFAPLVTLGNS